MIGVFDSGDGGLAAVARIRSLAPSADIIFYADRKNAPYGKKSRRELIRLTERDIIKLKSAGADRILTACCTASTVYGELRDGLRRDVYEIITPTASEAARVTENGKIAVIATEATVRSHAFSAALAVLGISDVCEYACGELVTMTESGCRDARLGIFERERIFSLLKKIRDSGADTLILGCTHFSHLESHIASCLGGIRTVNSAHEGARIIARDAKRGKGRTVILPP